MSMAGGLHGQAHVKQEGAESRGLGAAVCLGQFKAESSSKSPRGSELLLSSESHVT
jgi:hypothetical protein